MVDDKPFYSPILRLKEGEIIACAELTRDAKPYILPNFVAAPPGDRDPEKRRILTNDELVRENGLRTIRAWGQLPCLLDVRFLTTRLGVDDAPRWLPEIFRFASDAGGRPGVVVNLSDAHGSMLAAYRNALVVPRAFAAIRLGLADMQLPELEVQISAVLGAIRRTPAETVLVLDFGGADVGTVDVAADVIIGAYERLQSYGRWLKITLNITSYPEKTPAKSDELVLVPRTELAIWRQALASGAIDVTRTLVGDYGPDNAKFSWASAPVRPIPHYRYSTTINWLVVRGNKSSTSQECIRGIAGKLVMHEFYAGENFSYGDQYYFDSAKGKTVGGPKEWRAANVNHHLQFVVRQVGADLGIEIAGLPPRPQQVNMFEDLNS